MVIHNINGSISLPAFVSAPGVFSDFPVRYAVQYVTFENSAFGQVNHHVYLANPTTISFSNIKR